MAAAFKTIASLLMQVLIVGALGYGGWWGYQNRDSLPFVGGGGDGGPARAERPPTPVDVAVARTGAVLVTLEAIGTARANEAVTVMSDEMGLITEIHFAEGERVEAGGVLVSFDRGIQQAALDVQRAEIAVREAELEYARQAYARAERLMRTQNVAEAWVDELAANLKAAQAAVKRWQAALAVSRARLAKRVVRAPFAGRLGMRNVSVGTLVEPGDAIVTLDDISVIKLDFQVPERNLAHLQPGQEIAASTEAYPGRIFFGTVFSVDSRVDPVTRAVTMRAHIDNRDEALKPGMFLLVELGIATRYEAVIIPEEAVVANGNERYVFVVEDGIVRQAAVELGQRMPGEVEVVSGVAGGDTVVIGGVQKVRDGTAVAARERQATEAAAAE